MESVRGHQVQWFIPGVLRLCQSLTNQHAFTYLFPRNSFLSFLPFLSKNKTINIHHLHSYLSDYFILFFFPRHLYLVTTPFFTLAANSHSPPPTVVGWRRLGPGPVEKEACSRQCQDGRRGPRGIPDDELTQCQGVGLIYYLT